MLHEQGSERILHRLGTVSPDFRSPVVDGSLIPVLGRSDHPNVVKTVDLVRDERSRWCQVMAFCPGGDLFSAIKSGRMFRAEIDSYFKQILSGVAYLHSMGVAHRDIKPENIILDGKGGVKIVDFGVSDVFKMCWDREMHFSKGVCGSDPYLGTFVRNSCAGGLADRPRICSA